MTDNTDREKLIEEAAKAMHGDDIDKGRAGDDYTSMNLETLDWYRDNARAALAVFEKAHTPTEDEREALLRAIEGVTYGMGRLVGAPAAKLANAILAAGFRRTAVPEPTPLSRVKGALGEGQVIEVPEPSAEPRPCHLPQSAPPCIGCQCETQGEPSDVIDLDRIESLAKAATPGPWDFIFDGPTQDEDGSWYEPTESGVRSGIWENDFPHADAEFIAATDPQTVLALITALRAASSVTKGEAR